MAVITLASGDDVRALKPLADGEYTVDVFVKEGSGLRDMSFPLTVTGNGTQYSSPDRSRRSFEEFRADFLEEFTAGKVSKVAISSHAGSGAKAAGAGIGMLLGAGLLYWFLFLKKR